MGEDIEDLEGRYRIGFIIVDEARGDPETADLFREFGGALVEEGLPKPLKIDLCDDSFGVITSRVIDK